MTKGRNGAGRFKLPLLLKEGGKEDGDGNSEETEAVPFLLKSLFSSGNVEKPTEEEGKQTRLLLELISLLEPLLDGSFS